MNYNKVCPYVIILKDFYWRLCKLQHEDPVFCLEFKEDCPVYSKEYKTNTSIRHSEMSDDIVRTALNKENVEL